LAGIGLGGSVGFSGKNVPVPAIQNISDKKVKFFGYIDLGSSPQIFVKFQLDGVLSIDELIGLVEDLIQQAKGEDINVTSDARKKIPSLSIKDVTLFASTGNVRLRGKNYEPGLRIKGETELLGLQSSVDGTISKEGADINVQTKPFSLGELKITGKGIDKKLNTADDQLILNLLIKPMKVPPKIAMYGNVYLLLSKAKLAEAEIDIGLGKLEITLNNDFVNTIEKSMRKEIDKLAGHRASNDFVEFFEDLGENLLRGILFLFEKGLNIQEIYLKSDFSNPSERINAYAFHIKGEAGGKSFNIETSLSFDDPLQMIKDIFGIREGQIKYRDLPPLPQYAEAMPEASSTVVGESQESDAQAKGKKEEEPSSSESTIPEATGPVF
jgi:hypothetical protein